MIAGALEGVELAELQLGEILLLHVNAAESGAERVLGHVLLLLGHDLLGLTLGLSVEVVRAELAASHDQIHRRSDLLQLDVRHSCARLLEHSSFTKNTTVDNTY